MSIPHGYNIIKIPETIKKQIKLAGKLKKVTQNQETLKRSRQGNRSVPIITTKRKGLNFYQSQTYEKFSSVPLVSNGWKHRKSDGDYFKIHRFGKNPAFREDCGSFEKLGLDEKLVNAFDRLGFTKPTNIQSLAIPHILEGSNTIIAAETGNGKTYAYLAPLMQKVLEMKNSSTEHFTDVNAPKAIVIVPGRELVMQTMDMAIALGNGLGLNIDSIIGGRTKQLMLNPIIKNTDIIISSFGALSKLTSTGILRRENIKYLVLDEADTLLDDSFNEKVIYYLSKFPIRENQSEDVPGNSSSGVQVIFVGATFPTSIKPILEPILEIESLVHVKTPSLHKVPCHIDQTFRRVLHDDKTEMLLTLAKRLHKQSTPTIVFCNTSQCCDFVSLFLNENAIPCTHFNGNMLYHQRNDKFNSFQRGEINFMSCTDLGSRGLNTVRAEHIINFDFPRFISDYIHRCGRTGRVGGYSGTVTNFVMRPDEVELSQKIEYAVRKMECLPNVNANIKRIKKVRQLRYEKSREEVNEENLS